MDKQSKMGRPRIFDELVRVSFYMDDSDFEALKEKYGRGWQAEVRKLIHKYLLDIDNN